jgi:hypothetical protein
MRKIRLIFQRFKKQNRFDLLEDTIKWTDDSKEQNVVLEFRYVNLESDEVKTFSESYQTGG